MKTFTKENHEKLWHKAEVRLELVLQVHYQCIILCVITDGGSRQASAQQRGGRRQQIQFDEEDEPFQLSQPQEVGEWGFSYFGFQE